MKSYTILNTLTFGFLPVFWRRIIRYPIILWYFFISGLILDRLYKFNGFMEFFNWNNNQTYIAILLSFTIPQLISLILKLLFFKKKK